jgi:triosephosphate isomerase (TIM)
MRRKLVVGNWKMNGSLAANAVLLAGIKNYLGTPGCDVVVCAPSPYFAQCQLELSGTPVAWGGQDLSMHESGSYTGDISGAMLCDFNCRYVIVGHSERRAYHGETNEIVGQKTVQALKAGLTPIVCVGESLAEYDAKQSSAVVGRQIDAILEKIESGDLEKIVIAYEPIWAIGTGKTATPQLAQEVHAILRAKLAAKSLEGGDKVRILYGGSMKPENAKELLAMPDIDGGLIGGAALKAGDFLAIIHAA